LASSSAGLLGVESSFNEHSNDTSSWNLSICRQTPNACQNPSQGPDRSQVDDAFECVCIKVTQPIQHPPESLWTQSVFQAECYAAHVSVLLSGLFPALGLMDIPHGDAAGALSSMRDIDVYDVFSSNGLLTTECQMATARSRIGEVLVWIYWRPSEGSCFRQVIVLSV